MRGALETAGPNRQLPMSEVHVSATEHLKSGLGLAPLIVYHYAPVWLERDRWFALRARLSVLSLQHYLSKFCFTDLFGLGQNPTLSRLCPIWQSTSR